MKKALAVVLAAAFIGVFAGGALAQVPYMQIYFNNYNYPTQSPCGTGLTDLYLVGHNFNMFVQAVEYSVTFPGSLLYLSDSPTLPNGVNDLVIGNALIGEAVAYNIPQNGFVPMLLTTLHCFWTGNCDCAHGPQALLVGPYPGSPQPSLVSWPDFALHPVVGMTAVVCPEPVGVEATTWGGVKALYR